MTQTKEQAATCRLTNAQRFKAVAWFVANKEKHKTERPTLDKVAASLEEVVGGPVSAHTASFYLRAAKDIDPEVGWQFRTGGAGGPGPVAAFRKVVDERFAAQEKTINQLRDDGAAMLELLKEIRADVTVGMNRDRAVVANHQAAITAVAKRIGVDLPAELGFAPSVKLSVMNGK